LLSFFSLNLFFSYLITRNSMIYGEGWGKGGKPSPIPAPPTSKGRGRAAPRGGGGRCPFRAARRYSSNRQPDRARRTSGSYGHMPTYAMPTNAPHRPKHAHTGRDSKPAHAPYGQDLHTHAPHMLTKKEHKPTHAYTCLNLLAHTHTCPMRVSNRPHTCPHMPHSYPQMPIHSHMHA
jgi:hypothetical protein